MLQAYYLNNSDWILAEVRPGTLSKKHIEKYIKPYLEEDKELKSANTL